MPRLDGTGPRGQGPMTGNNRGFGRCGAGFGAGMGRGNGRGLGLCRTPAADSTEILQAQKEALQKRLEEIDKQLGKTTE